MAEEMDGEEFVVDKILDKRVRNGKIEYYLSWKVIQIQEVTLKIYYIHFRASDPKRIRGSQKRISTVQSSSRRLKTN